MSDASMQHEILISVGSNVEKEHNTTLGIQAMQNSFGKLVLSTVFESESVGFNGNNFYNLVVLARTSLSIKCVCQRLKAIEDKQGRTRDIKFGNRTLDLDLLTFDSVITSTPIKLPRGEIEYNAFVLQPMAEIVPNHIHPTTQKSYLILWSEFLLHSKNKHQRLWPSGFTYKGQAQ
ncbi:2-amino-4-hydroxy-6-hydroxymethyldihydropteridine diphosphokinase [Glaciecola punicea]|jgi:2-amino-4-hydroxy-6-hydroxymethyldihydropteridine diphosphokinase|nr:2-amino-4-hydroxy-6-hydroxymethyldihydropteridine diphosphokinase [Glaciecola punicea]OFA32362.1 2-amino-4-hydroxy-6-hydroxymethyldihydropteridine diphosphokinase [Glaciecola punicea]